MIRLLLAAFLTLLMASCQEAIHDEAEETASLKVAAPSFDEVVAANVKDREENIRVLYGESERRKAIRSVSLKLMKRLPASDEIATAAASQEGYDRVLDSYLNSETFASVILEYSKNMFEMGDQVADGVNYNEPANLAAYLAVNDLDFREILKADYCVNDDLEKIECSSFSDSADAQEYAAGAITTQAFLKKWESAFNFRRVSKAFQLFACKEYPDVKDSGLSAEMISESVKEFACSDCSPACISCHRSMNARASLFYTFDRKGQFNPNPDMDPEAGEVTVRDVATEASTVDDLLAEGAEPMYKGVVLKNIRDYAQHLADGKDFRDCVAQRMINFAFGKDSTERAPASLANVRESFGRNGYKIRSVLREVFRSPAYVLAQ